MAEGRILVVEDDAALREALLDTLELAGYAAVAAADAEEALRMLERQSPALMLSDVQMPGIDGHQLLRRVKTIRPGMPVILMTAYGQIDRAVEAMRDGAADYLPKPFEPERLLATVARHLPVASAALDGGPVARSPAMQSLLEMARRVAATDATVLLTGESGVGKEVVARYLHQVSPRRNGPFVAINCAAIPENLVESTLFGHEKGAFTGAAASQAGKFEQAQGGTLLLDEISELPLNAQAKLLRVLQERSVERLGGRSPIALDLRLVAASNRDLAAWVQAGRFREDLYYRLNVFPLEIPPLRQRREDILPLAGHFLEAFGPLVGRAGFTFSAAAEAKLTAYEWPGNIRELGNVVQRAMILAAGQRIDVPHLLLPKGREGPVTIPHAEADEPQVGHLRDVEKSLILDTLRRMQGSRKRTAEALGMSERTLRYKLRRFRLNGELDDGPGL